MAAHSARYSVSDVQKGARLRKTTSRMVQPPTAVMLPTATVPRSSMPLTGASTAPEWATETVPTQSSVRSSPAELVSDG